LKRGIAAILIFMLLMSSAACNKGKDSEEDANADQSTVEQTGSSADQTTTADEGTMSGEERTEEATGQENEKSDNFIFPEKGIRPFAVMIDNEGSRPLPQGGIYLAQVVYEIIVEGGVTRLMPVFWNVDPEMIGPVRSSRHYFLDYSMEHDAIYVHVGQSPQAEKDLKSLKINNVNGIYVGGGVFWDLTKDKNNWQDTYTSMEKVKEYVSRVKYRTETDKNHVFTYSQEDTEPANGAQKADKVSIAYSGSYITRYEYDPSSKTYMRYRNGKPHMERITGGQLSAKNIIIQVVKNQRIKGDTEDRQELFNIGNGKGWYITNGKAINIKWSKASRSEPTQYTDESGNPVILNPGQTWVQIALSGDRVTIE